MLDVKDGTQQLKLKDVPPLPLKQSQLCIDEDNIKITQKTFETLGFKVLLRTKVVLVDMNGKCCMKKSRKEMTTRSRV
jgi:hypothetical protein